MGRVTPVAGIPLVFPSLPQRKIFPFRLPEISLLSAQWESGGIRLGKGVSDYSANKLGKRVPSLAACFVYPKVVARGGIEPPTQGFSVLCSTD